MDRGFKESIKLLNDGSSLMAEEVYCGALKEHVVVMLRTGQHIHNYVLDSEMSIELIKQTQWALNKIASRKADTSDSTN